MKREIGSNFWLEPEQQCADTNINMMDYGLHHISDMVLTSTARSAEDIIINKIKIEIPDNERVALVPPFTCHTVINPLWMQGFKLYTYPIDRLLKTTPEMLRLTLNETGAKVVLMHRYFGFDTLKGCADIIKEFSAHGVIFIEDHTQSMYSAHEALPAQYHFGSFRKWMGVPDGGFAVSESGQFILQPTREHREMVELKLEASKLKYNYMQHKTDNKAEFRRLYQEAEDLLNLQKIPYSMSKESIGIQGKADIDSLKTRRRKNYKFVHEELKDSKYVQLLTPELCDEDIPLYLVITAEDRDALQTKLSEENIYAPVLWPKAENLPMICEEAEYLYTHALCLPIDQRYDLDDMDRMVKCINS